MAGVDMGVKNTGKLAWQDEKTGKEGADIQKQIKSIL